MIGKAGQSYAKRKRLAGANRGNGGGIKKAEIRAEQPVLRSSYCGGWTAQPHPPFPPSIVEDFSCILYMCRLITTQVNEIAKAKDRAL
jgi:hypothetical protein